ncbi:uncharacterized protein LOC144096622 [Amblyomma americanum]
MAGWQDPVFDQPLPAYRPQGVGGWFAQFEAALYLNGTTTLPFKLAALYDILPADLLCRLACPALGSRPYEELRAAILADFSVSYCPLLLYDAADPLSPPQAAGPAQASLSPMQPSSERCPPRQPLAPSPPLLPSISGPAVPVQDIRGRHKHQLNTAPFTDIVVTASCRHGALCSSMRFVIFGILVCLVTADNSSTGLCSDVDVRQADAEELSAKPNPAHHTPSSSKGPKRSKSRTKQDEAKPVRAMPSIAIVTRPTLPDKAPEAVPAPVLQPNQASEVGSFCSPAVLESSKTPDTTGSAANKCKFDGSPPCSTSRPQQIPVTQTLQLHKSHRLASCLS